MSKTIMAICYDFDNTLSTHEMQYWLAPKLGKTIDEFWAEQTKMVDVNFVLSYLWLTIEQCREKGITVTRDFLRNCGKEIEFFSGVKTWFKRINEYAASRGIVLEHYIISTGNLEMIEGTSIFKEFKKIYGCEYIYNKKGEAFWPKHVVNSTTKTQYLFRINKGINGSDDMEFKVNERVAVKRVEFRNMVYIGDGITDVPSMTLVKEKDGIAISVYNDKNKAVSETLIKDNRVNFACKADYSAGSELEKIVKLVIDSVSANEKLLKRENNI